MLIGRGQYTDGGIPTVIVFQVANALNSKISKICARRFYTGLNMGGSETL